MVSHYCTAKQAKDQIVPACMFLGNFGDLGKQGLWEVRINKKGIKRVIIRNCLLIHAAESAIMGEE